ncbi:hypothetical protein FA13DRAFT_1734801 [Coprinellus micaceus]|uniref:Uncharacterized protein n=1 Tax=Coprinellus micaceus TaxID=71717 RepID=A0A4Y7T4R2_COPMI|nr:hypothetical protein FA13DRAFT_1734801 [Coprinellus micaceus]
MTQSETLPLHFEVFYVKEHLHDEVLLPFAKHHVLNHPTRAPRIDRHSTKQGVGKTRVRLDHPLTYGSPSLRAMFACLPLYNRPSKCGLLQVGAGLDVLIAVSSPQVTVEHEMVHGAVLWGYQVRVHRLMPMGYYNALCLSSF